MKPNKTLCGIVTASILATSCGSTNKNRGVYDPEKIDVPRKVSKVDSIGNSSYLDTTLINFDTIYKTKSVEDSIIYNDSTRIHLKPKEKKEVPLWRKALGYSLIIFSLYLSSKL